jgi:long-chain acyl-CoA synthetase
MGRTPDATAVVVRRHKRPTRFLSARPSTPCAPIVTLSTMSNLNVALEESAALYPDAVAVRLDDCVLTYAALWAASARLAAGLLDEGLQPGDRVGVMLPNGPEFAVAYYGVLRAGGVVVPMNPLLKAREAEYLLSDSGARHLFVPHGSASTTCAGVRTHVVEQAAGRWRAPRIERDESDTAVILYTSGTTGQPKGAELTHGGLIRNAQITATTLLRLGPDDVILGCLPLFHAFGQTCCLNAAVVTGATITLMARFDPAQTLAVMQRDGVTVFEGVPTMYSALLEEAEHSSVVPPALRLCVSGGAAMPVETLHRFEATFGGVVLEGYGLSETSPVASFNHPDRPRKPGSIGTPIAGVELRLLPDGEIAIRGHNVMKGYWSRPEETAAAFSDGWFKTGDIGRVDDDGYYYVVDRKKELIIRGGFNVYPREVEEVLYEHPAVLEAAVVGLPHPSLGEEVGAAVVLRRGQSASPEQLRDFVKVRLAPYKYPRRVWIVDELPKGPTGKIMRRLVAAAQEGAGQ